MRLQRLLLIRVRIIAQDIDGSFTTVGVYPFSTRFHDNGGTVDICTIRNICLSHIYGICSFKFSYPHGSCCMLERNAGHRVRFKRSGNMYHYISWQGMKIKGQCAGHHPKIRFL